MSVICCFLEKLDSFLVALLIISLEAVFVFFFRDVSHIANDTDRNRDDNKDGTSNNHFPDVGFREKCFFLRVVCLI